MPRHTLNKSHSYHPNYSPRFVANTKSQDWSKNSPNAALLKQRLSRHRDEIYQQFATNHPHAVNWFKEKNFDLAKIRQHSQQLLAGAGLSTALLLSTPISPKLLPPNPPHVRLAEAGLMPLSTLAGTIKDKLAELVPQRLGHLDPENETKVQQIFKQLLGITASSILDGQRLNHSLGWIGYEQHLFRYPGDSLNLHEEELDAGIAPGLGGWGYFTDDSHKFTDQMKLYEKYYVAVQTLYLPSWSQDTKFLSDWYKFRKVLVVNVENGTVVVAVIGDAGPADWTGKQFGGSPEVMRALDLTGKKSKGKVLLWFIDDPQNQVPLGPVKSPVNEAVQLT